MKTVRFLLLVLLLALPFNGYSQRNLYGDVNGDGEVTIADVNAVIAVILGGTDPMPPDEDGDWVDLGLPSGTIWATRNVGASAPEDYGDYFAWGETEPKDIYKWSTYKWGGYDSNGNIYLTKYNTVSSYGIVDNKIELDASDDAACAYYPGGCMPSLEQIYELVNSCSWQWTQCNGVNGQLVTGPNGNTMFLPAAGCRWYDSLDGAGLYGNYWSRTLLSYSTYYAYGLYFNSGYWNFMEYYDRFAGFPVRAVRVP